MPSATVHHAVYHSSTPCAINLELASKISAAHLLRQFSENDTMKFGNWNVTDDTIEWQGGSFHRYVIDKPQLLSIEESGEFKGLYTALTRATEEDWLTGDDLYDLNFAFVYAAGKSGNAFTYEMFDATVAKVFELLDDEEDEQPSLGDISAEDAEAEQKRKEALSERD